MTQTTPPSARSADFIVIGAGIGGASIAYWLAPRAKVIVLERESQPGYHSTGRSAATFMESYGPAQVRALTRASLDFFQHPPAGFCDNPLLSPRGALFFAGPGQEALLAEHEASARAGGGGGIERLDAAQAAQFLPVLRQEQLKGAVLENEVSDIDVDALLQGFLRGARAAGAATVYGADIAAIARQDGVWEVRTQDGVYTAPVLVNAAGAWADSVAILAGAAPLGLVPKRRSAFLFAPPEGMVTAHWPLFMDVEQSFYIKPDAGMLLGSPCNADAVDAHDVQAEELDIAIAIDNIERLTTLRIRRPTHVWAGLRTFAADGEFVGGYDAHTPGLFWAAGQGGYGIQSAPAAGKYYADCLLGIQAPPPGLDPAAISPARFTPSGVSR